MQQTLAAQLGLLESELIGLGGFGEIGKSCALLRIDGTKILLDAGIDVWRDQGARYLSPSEHFTPEELDAVVLTHAHPDHSGALPILVRQGFRGRVYTTPPTPELLRLLYRDLLENWLENRMPLPFGPEDAERAIRLMVCRPYDQPFEPIPGATVRFRNAGHILGAALLEVAVHGGRSLIFTGDFRFGNSPLFPRAECAFHGADVAVVECTYGGDGMVHMPREEAVGILEEGLAATLGAGGTALIPAFDFGHAQEVLASVGLAMESGRIPEATVIADGRIPDATRIYQEHSAMLAPEGLRGLERLSKEHLASAPDSSERALLAAESGPKVVLSPSGMLTHGPVLDYFRASAIRPINGLIFVSFQARGTLGRRIVDGERRVPIGEAPQAPPVEVRARVWSCNGFSGHCTRHQIMEFLGALRPRPALLIPYHGQPQSLETIGALARSEHRLLALPYPKGTRVPLDGRPFPQG